VPDGIGTEKLAPESGVEFMVPISGTCVRGLRLVWVKGHSLLPILACGIHCYWR